MRGGVRCDGCDLCGWDTEDDDDDEGDAIEEVRMMVCGDVQLLR